MAKFLSVCLPKQIYSKDEWFSKYLTGVQLGFSEYAIKVSIINDHLNWIQWARNNGCPLPIDICFYATYAGRLNNLEWARENGFPWDSAAEIERLDILHWPPRKYMSMGQ